MNKTLLSMLLACSFFNVFSMDKNPCWAWTRALTVACQKGSLDTQLLNEAELRARKSGCTRVSMVESKDCKPFFDQAGAQAECPRLLAVNGPVAYYDYQKCRYSKFFESKGN